ncbi:hypothetical protein, partial [Brevundimonas nasdae]|uniref:hypothetical protein n=1 Tax=Brevundimonas nasdae TaxID=172043 RepID=UPI00289743E3
FDRVGTSITVAANERETAMRHSVLWEAVAVMVGTPAHMAAAQTGARPADEAEVLNLHHQRC